MSGQSIGGILGGIVGTFIPGVGPQLGFAIGSALGGIADPVQIKGPRLSDASRQTSQEGVPIPFGYGTMGRLAGNLIWADALVEHKHKEGGKGGPQTTTYTYTRSYAIGICAGLVTAVQKVWRNGKLVYDISDGSTILGTNNDFLRKATFYLGDETQTVDPTIEAVVGVGNSGPMRGLCYMVLEDDDLTDSQGMVAQYEFVVQHCGTLTELDNIPVTTTYTPDLSAVTYSGTTSAVGYTISGLNTTDTVRVLMPSGRTYSGWSQYADDIGPHANSWGCGFNVTNAAATTTDYHTTFDDIYVDGPTALAAAQASLPITLTGSTSYTFWIQDTVPADNRGGLSLTLQVREAPDAAWTELVEAPDVYVDKDGEIITDYVTGYSLSSCGAYLDDILLDLCERSGIDSTEVDASALSAIFVKGFKCAAGNGSAQGYMEALGNAFFFDRTEYDKKIRFVPRGGTSVASLTTDDLVARNGPAIEQTRIQESELLRKVSVITIDPAAEYNPTVQTWERRAGTVQAKGELAAELQIVTTTDTAKQIAEKKGKIAWAETDKFKFALPQKWSKLVPADIVELTDKQGAVHTLRISSMGTADGVIEVEEAIKTRSSIYESTAVGVLNPNTPATTTPGFIGPTLFAAMNLPQLRTQDNVPGIYVGATGMLDGWSGCQIYVSYDGGTSYVVALTITEPTIMGTLTASITNSGTPLSVHVFGGDLVAATTAQVTAGANYSAVISSGTAEVLAYEAIAESPANYYDLTTLSRGLLGTTAASHASADQFVDLNTAHFLPISQDYAGDTLYFKAVAFGLSADDITPVSFVYEGVTYVVDGGGA